MHHFLADDGAKILLQIAGDGPSVVMLHGWAASHLQNFGLASRPKPPQKLCFINQ